MKITPENIIELPSDNSIFVFGSNLAGRHGKGAALIAKQKFGAKTGIGEGHQGNSYAIPTKNWYLKSMPMRYIRSCVIEFLEYAKAHPELEFLVTAIGTGLAGYSAFDIAPMFDNPPSNVSLPQSFWDVIIVNDNGIC